MSAQRWRAGPGQSRPSSTSWGSRSSAWTCRAQVGALALQESPTQCTCRACAVPMRGEKIASRTCSLCPASCGLLAQPAMEPGPPARPPPPPRPARCTAVRKRDAAQGADHGVHDVIPQAAQHERGGRWVQRGRAGPGHWAVGGHSAGSWTLLPPPITPAVPPEQLCAFLHGGRTCSEYAMQGVQSVGAPTLSIVPLLLRSGCDGGGDLWRGGGGGRRRRSTGKAERRRRRRQAEAQGGEGQPGAEPQGVEGRSEGKKVQSCPPVCYFCVGLVSCYPRGAADGNPRL